MTPDQIIDTAIWVANKAFWAKLNAAEILHHLDPMRAAVAAYERALWRPVADVPPGVPVVVRAPNGQESLWKYDQNGTATSLLGDVEMQMEPTMFRFLPGWEGVE